MVLNKVGAVPMNPSPSAAPICWECGIALMLIDFWSFFMFLN